MKATYRRLGQARVREGEKWCSTCREWWPVGPGGCFSRDRTLPDGWRNECKACRKERRVARGDYAKDWARERARRLVVAA